MSRRCVQSLPHAWKAQRTPARSLALPLALLCLVVTPPLAAQGNRPGGGAPSTQNAHAEASPQARGPESPLWFGVGIGGGGTRLTCDFCQPSRDLGPFLTVTAGSRTASGMRVGVEFGGWSHDDDGIRETVYRAGVVAHLIPLPGRGLYLIGGFGWSGYRADAYRYDAPRLSVGAGWDLSFLPGWLIGNELVVDGAALGSLKNDDITVARRVGLSTVRFSVHLRHR